MKRTLVIHPKDETTDFLKSIYSNRNWDIITNTNSKEFIKNEIKTFKII